MLGDLFSVDLAAGWVVVGILCALGFAALVLAVGFVVGLFTDRL